VGAKPKEAEVDLGLFALHAVIGLLLVGHGLQKLIGAFGGHGLEGTAGFMDSLGLSPGRFSATAAGLAETVGGGLLALGLFTPIAAALVISVMVTAALTAHAGKPIWAQEGGPELPLVNTAAVFALAGASPGAWSLDNAFGIDLAGAGWALGALAIGVIGGIAVVAVGRIQVERRQREQRYRRDRRRPGQPVTG
jgi:putative oxidoreductase